VGYVRLATAAAAAHEPRRAAELERKALADIDRLVRLNPERSWPYRIKAFALVEFGRHEEAAEATATAERHRSEQPDYNDLWSDARLAELYRSCRALLYPQHEDFGLVALEAQAAGRPVIGFGRGGLLDTVQPLPTPGPVSADATDGDEALDATGLFFSEQTPEAICTAVERFEKLESRFDPRRLRRWAERFSPARFDRALDAEIAAALAVTGSTVSAHEAGGTPRWTRLPGARP